MNIVFAFIAGFFLITGVTADACNWHIARLPTRSDGGRVSPIMAVPTGCYILAVLSAGVFLRLHKFHWPYLVALLVLALGLLILFDFVCTFGPFERRKQL